MSRLAAGTVLLLALFPGLAWGGEAQRVVSVGGALTEIVYALGEAGRLVATDTTSRYPPTAEDLPKVGYQRSLSAEGVLSMRPDLLLAADAAGPPAALDQIRSAGVPVVTVAGEDSPGGVLDKVAGVAAALGREAAGEALSARLRGELDALESLEPLAGTRVLFLLNVGLGAPMVAGHDTSADAIIRLAGAANAMPDHEGYKPISPEGVVLAAPTVVLLTDRTLELSGGVDGVLRLPGLVHTPAGRARRVVAMDGLLLLGFGPRTAEAARGLRAALEEAAPAGGTAMRQAAAAQRVR
jgi:iron complex transport system substrate-binding protein